jgi:hypothetical protein
MGETPANANPNSQCRALKSILFIGDPGQNPAVNCFSGSAGFSPIDRAIAFVYSSVSVCIIRMSRNAHKVSENSHDYPGCYKPQSRNGIIPAFQ